MKSRGHSTRKDEHPFGWCLGLIISALVVPAVCSARADYEEQPRFGPAFEGRLELLNAVRIALAKNPAILLQNQEVAIARGRVQEKKGKFDTRLTSSIAHDFTQQAIPAELGVPYAVSGNQSPDTLVRLANNFTILRAAVEQPLRSGIVVGPEVDMTRTDDNLSGLPVQNRADVNFALLVPLARGLGKKAVAAEERAAKIDYEASRLTLEYTISQQVLNTATTYWGYLAARRRLEILLDSENRARALATNTTALVELKEIPRAELDHLTANLEEKVRNRIAATQATLEARQDLGLVMGLQFEEIDRLPPPADSFPQPDAQLQLELPAEEQLVRFAIEKRPDLRAARLGEKSSAALLDLAKNQLEPQLDLTLRVGYGGFDQGSAVSRFFTPYGENIEGLNASAALRFDWPPANNAARGRYRQQQAIHTQRLIHSDDLARNIRSSVLIVANRLRSRREELVRSQLATNSYLKAVENEKEKRRLGLSTFTDVLFVEDRLTSAALENLAAQAQYATEIVRLRFETGSLLSEGQSGESITSRQLFTLPGAEEIGPRPEPP